MAVTDEALKADESYAKNFNQGNLPMPPAKKLAVVACMDARLTIEPMLGLKTGDAHIIRNAGGIVTGDVLRSLIISEQLLGTSEIMIINHTDCGMLTFKDEELEQKLKNQTGQTPILPDRFHAFTDLQQNVREQMGKLRLHPWIPQSISIRGFVYDVKTGKLTEVTTPVEVRRAA